MTAHDEGLQKQASPIVIDDEATVSHVKKWIPELGLSNHDREVLLSDAWLTDSIVNGAQKLLKKRNPLISGLQDVALGLTMTFNVEPEEFVQILHTGAGHWLTISTIGVQHPQVQVFDPKYSTCPPECKAQIATLLATEHSSFQLNYINVQMQSGSNDCGLFAIAFATALVFAEKPGTFFFDQAEMRKHLLKCLITREITQFPVKRMRHSHKNIKRTEKVKVYCKCRMPELPGSKWIECSKCGSWFHIDICVNVSDKYLKENCSWYCHQCS